MDHFVYSLELASSFPKQKEFVRGKQLRIGLVPKLCDKVTQLLDEGMLTVTGMDSNSDYLGK